MRPNGTRCFMSALGAAAMIAASGASANLIYIPADNALFKGSGLGAVNTVLTLKSPGSSDAESGAVFADGAGFGTSGDAGTGASQVGLPTLGSLGVISTSNLRIILNADEPAANSITVGSLALSFYDAVGATLGVFSLAAPVTFPSTLNGIGQAGFVFGLDAAQAALATSFIGASATNFANERIGLSALLTDATGGPDTFFVGNAASVTAVAEPETYLLMLAGLAAIGFTVRRRMG